MARVMGDKCLGGNMSGVEFETTEERERVCVCERETETDATCVHI